MLEVRWSHALLALSFIVFLLLLGSYKQFGITFIPLKPTLWPYSNLVNVSHTSSIALLLITINLMLHLQEIQTKYKGSVIRRYFIPNNGGTKDMMYFLICT